MTKISGKQIALDKMASATSSNLLRYNVDGLYVALVAAANVAQQYVSTSTGNDANDGSRASPLRTIAYALSRVPDNTSGTIYLYETDTFPVRAVGDPEVWGSTITYFGSALSTGYRNIIFTPYGSQTDTLTALTGTSTSFHSWLLASAPRPILEFGHYVYNGKPVGCSMVLGAESGRQVIIQGCEIRITDAARATVASTGIGLISHGYDHLLACINTTLRGCVFPAPIVYNSNTVTRIVTTYNQLGMWQCSIPSDTAMWISVSGCSNIDIVSSGPAVYDGVGTSYPTVPNTIITNIPTRIAGLIRDGIGTIRNIASSVSF